MIPVDTALDRVLTPLRPLPAEVVALTAACDRVLAEPITARRTQPPADMSAMDGYAVRAADVADPPVALAVVGAAPAGGAFDRALEPGQAVRIFTGGPVPAGADTVVIQEDTETGGDGTVRVLEAARPGRHIRRQGIDFAAGDVLLDAGRRLTARDIALAASGNVPWLAVRRRARVAILTTGDELVRPGEPLDGDRIVNSNSAMLAGVVTSSGGVAVDLGIARDDAASLKSLAEGARGADFLVTIGGASVGDHDLIRKVLGDVGLTVDFWKIAMRPGKPLISGMFAGIPMLGLPGNPVSAYVCAELFLRPALDRLHGLPPRPAPTETARLAEPMAANGGRQDYVRATLDRDDNGALMARPNPVQDSSMLSVLAAADCLIVRPPGAAAAGPGDEVPILRLDRR